MKFCSTCLSFCPPPPPISAKTNSGEAVVSGQLVFVHQGDPTPSAGSSDTKNISSDKIRIPTDISSGERLVFVNTAEISTQKNSELFQMPVPVNHLAEFQLPIFNQEVKPQFQGMQAQAPGAQELFQSPIPIPIPIKEALGQDQSTSLNSEVQIFDQKKYLGQSMWDIPPSNSATPLPQSQSLEFVFGVGFMSIRRRDGVPSSMNGVEISQSPSQIDKSIQNESRYPSPTPSPEATSGGDKAVRYLLV